MEVSPMCNIIAYVIALISSFVNPSNMEAVAAPKTVAIEPTSVVCFTEVEQETILKETVLVPLYCPFPVILILPVPTLILSL